MENEKRRRHYRAKERENCGEHTCGCGAAAKLKKLSVAIFIAAVAAAFVKGMILGCWLAKRNQM